MSAHLRIRAAAAAALFGLSVAPGSAFCAPPASTATENGYVAQWRALNQQVIRAYQEGNLEEGVRLARAALAFAESKLGEDSTHTLSSMNNLAMFHQSIGQTAEAEPLLLRALAARERTLGVQHAETLTSLNNLGTFYLEQGRMAEAERAFLRALSGMDAAFGPDHRNTIALLNNLAVLYQDQERDGEAEPLFRRAMTALERSLGADHPDTLTAISNLGGLYLGQERLAEAEPLAVRAWRARERTQGPDHPETVAAMANVAAIYHAQGRHSDADPLFRQALAGTEARLGPDHPDTLAIIENFARLLRSQRNLADAESLHERLRVAAARTFGRLHPTSIRAATDLARMRMAIPERASTAIEPARDAAAALRSRWATGDNGIYSGSQRYREESQLGLTFAVLANAAWAAATLPERDSLAGEAFVAMQEASAGSVSRAVARTAVQRLAEQQGTDLAALVREREALGDRWRTNAADHSESYSSDDPGTAEFRQQALEENRQIEARLAQIDLELAEGFPEYFALVTPRPLSPDEARALLEPDEALIQLLPTELGVHVVALSRDGMAWHRSEWSRQELDQAVRRLLWDVGASVDVDPAEADRWAREAGPGLSFGRRTAHSLYRQLVHPVASVLSGKRHVFVAAAGSLSSLPFGILVTEEPGGSDADPEALRATRWLADSHALVQIPSAQSLRFLRSFRGERSDAPADGFVGFGDPLLDGSPVARARGTRAAMPANVFSDRQGRSGARLADVSMINRMSRLPGTAPELENIRAALGAPESALFLAERATEANFRTTDLSGRRIIVLATHGLVGGELPGLVEPGLVFTPPDTPSESDDGLLTASEIAALRLDADWVILSACNTAAGDGSAGSPGLSGLARAFFYAGARNLLVSHWPVRDDVAARLTVRTLELMAASPSTSRAEALQMAMREVRDDRRHDRPDDSWAHPSAWAPFALVGDATR